MHRWRRKVKSKSHRLALSSTVQMDKVFIEALTNEEVCGNRVDGQFTSRAYDTMLKA